jgi:hypothetical protein
VSFLLQIPGRLRKAADHRTFVTTLERETEMASKERNSKRRVGIDAEVTPLQLQWLRGEELPDTFDAAIIKFDTHGTNAALWATHREMILDEHVKEFPGIRPKLWWEFDAPRWLDEYRNGLSDHELPEPRKRLGGIGTEAYLVLNWKPCFHLGLPVHFVSPFDVEYYGGTMRHVVTGQLVNPGSTFTGVAIDSDDPPLYESQSSYLDRHGLFLAGERKRLKAADFEPETMAYVDDK